MVGTTNARNPLRSLLLLVGGLTTLVLLNVAGTSAQQGVPLTYEYLWNPESPNIEEWQILGPGSGGVSGIIWGNPGDIFLIDGGKACVLWLTREGDLVQIIGRRGQGPGEFIKPVALAFDSTTEALWVADGNFRYSRFSLKNDEYVYQDSFRAPISTTLLDTP